jgi:hypothetical protein
MPAVDFDELILPLVELLRRFLAGEWDYPAFQPQFKRALQAYQHAVRDKAYWPLDVIADIPQHCRASLHNYCRQAIERLPKESLDRSTRQWLDTELIATDRGYTFFSFYDSDGRSRFGDVVRLYSAKIDSESYLLSALNSSLVPPSFRYADLLSSLRDTGGNELATWVYGTEPDNALANVECVWSLGDTYAESHQLRRLERSPAEEGGPSNLMLLPKSKRWMLLNEADGGTFTISLHGSRTFIDTVAMQIKVHTL